MDDAKVNANVGRWFGFAETYDRYRPQPPAAAADRLVGLALSQARVSRPLMHGATEEQIGLAALREVARRTLGDEPRAWYFSYRVRLGIK